LLSSKIRILFVEYKEFFCPCAENYLLTRPGKRGDSRMGFEKVEPFGPI
jgi:hypothetical protein